MVAKRPEREGHTTTSSSVRSHRLGSHRGIRPVFRGEIPTGRTLPSTRPARHEALPPSPSGAAFGTLDPERLGRSAPNVARLGRRHRHDRSFTFEGCSAVTFGASGLVVRVRESAPANVRAGTTLPFGAGGGVPRDPDQGSATRRNRSAFAITETDERLIAALAIIGESTHPKNGYSTPAASGIPSAL